MIRKLASSDAREYKNIRLLALTTDPDAYFATLDEEKKRELWSYEAELRSGNDLFGYYGWFEDEGDLSSYVQISKEYFQKQQHVANLYNLYVHPEHRKRGIGKALVTYIISQAKATKLIETIFLSVMAENSTAIHLYSSLGFTEYGRKQRSIKIGSRYIGEFLMRLDLEQRDVL